MQKKLRDLCRELGLVFCSTQVPSWVEPSLQKLLSCGIYVSYLGLGTMCEVVSPSIHAINGWDCTIWPQVNWDHVWMSPKLLCYCLCLFDAIVELYALDRKMFIDFLIGKWKWIEYEMKAYLIHALYFAHVVVKTLITLNWKLTINTTSSFF